LCCVYLPPLDIYGGNEQAWRSELSGLEGDMRMLGEGALMLLIGDWNAQPPSISGRPDNCPTRGRELDAFCSRWSLVLLNPNLNTSQTVGVPMPFQGHTIDIHPGTTWHNVNSKGRAIDLAFATCAVQATLAVHNGIDCKSSGACPWDECVEYCAGDHFLLQASLVLPCAPELLQARPVLPHAWHRDARWNDGFIHAAPALEDGLYVFVCLFVCFCCCVFCVVGVFSSFPGLPCPGFLPSLLALSLRSVVIKPWLSLTSGP
jgi:hypothetical protein